MKRARRWLRWETWLVPRINPTDTWREIASKAMGEIAFFALLGWLVRTLLATAGVLP